MKTRMMIITGALTAMLLGFGPSAVTAQDVKGKVEAGGNKAPRVELQVGDTDNGAEKVVKETREVTHTESIPSIWLIAGGLGILLVVVLAVMAARGSGGTTIVRERS